MTETTSNRLRPEILDYYERGGEIGRLRSGTGLLEFWRTQDVLRRVLPAAPARVLDVGGGSGVHAEWLAGDGYRVELVDPVPLHVEHASGLPGVTARLGDARALDAPDDSVDAVLLLGPLYHLPEREERLAALREARRVVRPGGAVVVATINRFAGLHDTIRHGVFFEGPERRALIEAASTDGVNRISEQQLFTTAYSHHPEAVVEEFTAAGLDVGGQYGVEGAAWLMPDCAENLADPERCGHLLDAMRRTESVPSLLGVSGHLLTVARIS